MLTRRVLFIGESWYGSNSGACVGALRRLGVNVAHIDEQRFMPQVSMFASRVIRRLLRSRFVDEFNRAILEAAESFRPDIMLAFKGNYILAPTLRALRTGGIRLYNYFPDTSAFSHGPWLANSLPEYDCVFYTKPFWYGDVTKRISLRNAAFLPHGYCAEIARPVALDARDIADYACDVALIANHTGIKERMLEELVSLRPCCDLRIWGLKWNSHCRSEALQRCIQGHPLWGESYIRALQAVRINLAIMTGERPGASSGDFTTARTYAIPATGSFMLHERNPEVLDLYKEDEEIACFSSPGELAEKIDYYLEHPVERARIAKAGYARCVPAYSYDNRVEQILLWHSAHDRRDNVAVAAVHQPVEAQ